MANLIGILSDYAYVPKKACVPSYDGGSRRTAKEYTIIRRAASKRIYVFLKASVRR